MAHRRDEEPKTWFRSERVFRVDSDWFIHTREGIAVGPYPDKFAADVDAEMLKSLLVGIDGVEAVDIIRSFMSSEGRDLLQSQAAQIDMDGEDAPLVVPRYDASLLDDGFDTAQAI